VVLVFNSWWNGYLLPLLFLQMPDQRCRSRPTSPTLHFPGLVPTSLAALQVGSVTDREVSRALIALVRSGWAESSVKRFRDSLSAFFAWAVRERMIATNPVTPTRVP
jgi:hypothetical protein